jgi:hypothetical protein
MNPSTVTCQATLQADGVTLHLDNKVPLSPGRVMVTMRPTTQASGPTMLEVLSRIHREQRQRGRQPMTEEEMAADIARMRAEDDE